MTDFPWGDAVKGAGSGFLGALTGLFAEGRAPAEFLAQLQQFSMSFLKHAPQRFGMQMMTASRCGRYRCSSQAMAVCEGCGAGVCLEHGWFSHTAETLCVKCARLAVRNISGDKSWGRGRRDEEEEEARQAAGNAQGAPPHEVALAALGLPETAGMADVKRRFRSLSMALHPDRLETLPAAHREEARDTYSRCAAAYSLLEKHFQRAA